MSDQVDDLCGTRVPPASKILSEEAIYAQALAEMSGKDRRQGVWARSLSESLGDERKTEALYIRYRVSQMLADQEAMVEKSRRVPFACPKCRTPFFITADQLADLLAAHTSAWRKSCPSCHHIFDRRTVIPPECLKSAMEGHSTVAPVRASGPERKRGRPPNYVLAVLACAAILGAYILTAIVCGWRHGGGYVPLVIVFTLMAGAWTALAGNRHISRQ